jgi:WD40 repeat protein
VGRLSARTDGVTSLSASADGRRLLAGGIDKVVRLWDLDSERELRRFEGHEGWVVRVALSPDARWALSCSGYYERRESRLVVVDSTARLWDTETGAEVRRLGTYDVPLTTVAFSPDGRQALVAGGGHEVQGAEFLLRDGKTVPRECLLWLYDVESGRELRRFIGHKQPVTCAAFTPDRQRLVSAAADGTVRVWDAATGSTLRTVEVGGKGAVRALAVAPNGGRLAVGDTDSGLRLWDLETGEEEYALRPAHTGWVRAVAFSADGTQILSGGDDFLVRLWQADTGALRRHFTGHAGNVTCVAFLPDGQRAVSGSNDGTVRIWRLPR